MYINVNRVTYSLKSILNKRVLRQVLNCLTFLTCKGSLHNRVMRFMKNCCTRV